MNWRHLWCGAHLLFAALQERKFNSLQLVTAAGRELWLKHAPADRDDCLLEQVLLQNFAAAFIFKGCNGCFIVALGNSCRGRTWCFRVVLGNSCRGVVITAGMLSALDSQAHA